MNQRLKGTLLLAAGVVVGSLCTGTALIVFESHRFQERYYTGILDNANVAYMIGTGREKDLVRSVEANLVQCVVAADRLYGKDQKRLPAFWLVQRYYKKLGCEPPAEIAPILATLPPRPLTSCEKAACMSGKDATRRRKVARPAAGLAPSTPSFGNRG